MIDLPTALALALIGLALIAITNPRGRWYIVIGRNENQEGNDERVSGKIEVY